ncbi:MAG: hypothetical protein IT189_04305 [Microbacteriaceae bacterium]|jgi:hypothetical protein|nr:hypothetical protein [Microbacteriaceae bacterium]
MRLSDLDDGMGAILGWANGDVVNVFNMWDICRKASQDQGNDEIRIRAATYTAYLIGEGLMVPGVSSSDGNKYVFERWQGTPASWIPLVVGVWSEIHDEPQPGEYFELTLTSEGQALVDQM